MANRKERDLRQRRLAKYRQRKRDRRKQKRMRLSAHQSSAPPIIKVPYQWVLAPTHLALEGKRHDRLAKFLAELRQTYATGTGLVCIDFRRVESMVAGGALLFFCELQRLTEMYPHVILTCKPAKVNVVNQILTHLGIYALCGHTSAVTPERSDVIDWKTASSNTVQGDFVGRIIEESLEGELAKQAFRGASEAMINSVNHAYEAPRHDGLPDPYEKKWWMFCRHDRDSNRLSIAVCDLGIGIPRSLPLKYSEKAVQAAMNLLSFGRRHTDARLIQAAIEIARTRTNHKGRGLGLHNLKRLVDVSGLGGALYIFSNAGLVHYRGNTFERHNFKRSILATVVVWSIPLGGKNE